MIMTPVQGGPIARFLRLIRFSHTIFALPFALGALIVAANGWPSLRILLLVIVCMVLARTAAMLFNRLVDWSLDQRNPRTASRHLLISKLSALILLILSSAAFLLAASAINRLTFLLAPVALASMHPALARPHPTSCRCARRPTLRGPRPSARSQERSMK